MRSMCCTESLKMYEYLIHSPPSSQTEGYRQTMKYAQQYKIV